MMRTLLVLGTGLALVGSITLSSDSATLTTTTIEPEVQMGALASGSSGGLNGSAGTASITGLVLSQTTNVLYLNNTNATGAYYAKLVVTASSGIANLPALVIGIDNGTQNAQIVGTLGSLTQTSGQYVQLLAASTNRIYVTQAVTTLALTSTITMDVYAADDTSESAYVITSLTITIQ
ncbi:MAG: hypothetical protein WDA16_13010 [Candidatus Thermoplasmatota archaeon]